LIENILDKQEKANIEKRRINSKISIKSRRNGKKFLKEIHTIPLEFRIDNEIDNQKVLEVVQLKCYYCFSNFQNFKLKSSIFSDLSKFKPVFYLIKTNIITTEQEDNMRIPASEKKVVIKDFIMERVINKFQNIKNLIKNISIKTKCTNECSKCISEPKYLEKLVSDTINITKPQLQVELKNHNHEFKDNKSKVFSKKELSSILEDHYNHFHSIYLNQNNSLKDSNITSDSSMSSLNLSKGLFSNKTLPITQDSNNRISIISTKQTKIINNIISIDKFCYICNKIYSSENEQDWINCDICGDSRLCGDCASSDEFTCINCIQRECEKQLKSKK